MTRPRKRLGANVIQTAGACSLDFGECALPANCDCNASQKVMQPFGQHSKRTWRLRGHCQGAHHAAPPQRASTSGNPRARRHPRCACAPGAGAACDPQSAAVLNHRGTGGQWQIRERCISGQWHSRYCCACTCKSGQTHAGRSCMPQREPQAIAAPTSTARLSPACAAYNTWGPGQAGGKQQ